MTSQRLYCLIKVFEGTSFVVKWLGLCTFIAGGTGSIPGQGTKILHAEWCGQKNKKHQCLKS